MVEGAYWQLLHYSIHLIAYFILSCCQSLSWRITGVHRHIVASRNSENYGTSAQLLKVWSRSRMLHPIIPQLRHFLTSHVKFVHPEFALQRHIAILSVSKEYVLFSVPRRDVDVYDMNRWSFLFDAVFEEAEYILVMPTVSFNKLASSIPPTKAKVLWIYHTGRCGSTALAQVFNSLPDAVAMSEPMTFTALLHSFRDYKLSNKHDVRTIKQYRTLFHSLVRMTLKPSLKHADIITIKSAPLNAFADFDLMTEMFPQIKIIFMYRDVMPQVTSLYKAIEGQELATTISSLIAGSALLSKLFPKVTSINSEYNRCYLTREHAQWMACKEVSSPLTLFAAFVMSYAESCHHYRDIVRQHGSSIPAFKFEKFMSEKKKHFSILFQLIEVEFTEKLWFVIQNALELDSQLKSFVSREKVSNHIVRITPEMIDDANDCLKFFNLPKWGEAIILPNTVL
ncbi:uncharacterized protein [Watersipora subatra]|uniref:uncharacterized protein n=1 Tax=Watersipora subatra TaxID=2589382 RepID=UPI00355B182E